MPEPTAFEIKIATENLKEKKSPGTDRIPTEIIKGGDRTIRFYIHKLLILF